MNRYYLLNEDLYRNDNTCRADGMENQPSSWVKKRSTPYLSSSRDWISVQTLANIAVGNIQYLLMFVTELF
jgi:hypothetical protein